MVGRVQEVGKETFLVFCESEGFMERQDRHLEEAERVFEHDVSSVNRQQQDLGSIDDLFWHKILFVEFVQDQVKLKALGIVGQDCEFKLLTHFPQPIQEIGNACVAFEIKQFVAVGGGSAYQVGHVDTHVLHGFAVPVDKQIAFLFPTE